LNSRSREAAARFAERRKREDEAPRLSAELPRLKTLRLAIEERRGSIETPETKHTRLVVVAHAPALFLVPCGDPSCLDGGHDVTDTLMRQLRAGAAEVVAEHECQGSVGTSHCGRVLRVRGEATYA
jgi:hypothetical protein